MRRMCFKNHRATSGKGRCRVPSRHRKSKREIAGAKYTHGPQGNLDLTKIGLLPGCIGRVNANIRPGTFFQQTGKKPQLIHSSSPRSEEHTSELQSLMRISYAIFCLTKKTTQNTKRTSKQP